MFKVVSLLLNTVSVFFSLQLSPSLNILTDKQALYLKSPEIPTAENFDQFLDKYGGATFSAEPDSWDLDTDAQNPPDANGTSRYEVNYLLSNRR